MKPEEQRIAIAEACGWRFDEYPNKGTDWIGTHPTEGSFKMLPDYLRDLNAMQSAVLSLSGIDQQCWVDALKEIVGIRTDICLHYNPLDLANATAPQRAEAFLKTISKWKEQP